MLRKKIEEVVAPNNQNKLYGILLFTEKDPTLINMLKNETYYEAINLRSGEELDIFATMLFKGTERYPKPRPGEMSFMLPIWVEPRQNEELFSLFDIKDSRELPRFVLFGVNSTEEGVEYSYYHKAKINTESIETAYKSIEEIITIATDAVKTLEEKGSYNRDQLEKLLSKKLTISKVWTGLKEIIKRLPFGALLGKIF
ncbi:hypothetical protein AB7942_23915 [Neobacillus sp. BF23-41]|uniref:hypothetical protein n=1 Tax=Neobacillus sp. BF23-41 TaxID=3240280 RepID=UPI0034E375F7